MKLPPKYKYRYRPGYGSDKLLIEFTSGVELETFITDFLDAIKEINPLIVGLGDLWMNDEILYSVNSDAGQFTLSKDIWDFSFVASDDNQPCISRINTLLLNDIRFAKVYVDFSEFK